MRRTVAAIGTLAAALGSYTAAGGAPPMGTTSSRDTIQVEQNHVAELQLRSTIDYADPFNTVTLDAVVTDPDGREFRVPGFWAGGDRWRIRYASGVVGTHTYRTECPDPANAGLHGVTGEIGVIPYTGDNPLYRHGPVRVGEDSRHLAYADGTPFLWLGDTWWMALCKRLHWPEEFRTLAEDRVAKGFTVIQIVAGLYPDMPAFDERGANEAGFPWEADYARIRPEYFDAADERLKYLVDSGLTPCIVGAWGYFMPWMGVEKLEQHWRYLVARYGALPVVWCIAGEANLPWYLVPGFPYDDREQVKGWTEVARYLRKTDPFHRLTSIHPTGLGRLSARGAIDDVSLIDFDMLQTGHGQREVLPPTIETLRWSYDQQPTMPVLNSEVAYEALLGTIPAETQRLTFWSCMLSGAAGHTYGANGIWQVNRADQPHGASPHGGNYGTTPWNEAMNLPGSGQLALAKRLLERYPWYRFEPHPEWASFDATPPGANAFEVPYAAGIPGHVRVIYVPLQETVIVHDLEAGADYQAFLFDPVTGEASPLGEVLANADGQWTCFAPGGDELDWVLVLEADGSGGLAESEEQVALGNDALQWQLETVGETVHSTALANKRTGHTMPLRAAEEVALVLSAAADRVQEPFTRVSDFRLTGTADIGRHQAAFRLRSPPTGLEVILHYQLDGPTRRKWAEVRNTSERPLLLLDVELDGFTTHAPTSEGGQGQPLFLADEAFAAIEYPSGENTQTGGRVKLAHFPGRLLAPGESYTTHSALISVAEQGQALSHFVEYIDERSVRSKRVLSVYTPFGINNQWGPCPTLTDEETLDVLDRLAKWRDQGMHFDYFTLDTGWVDPTSDLTRFRPNAYPNGPEEVIRRVRELGMGFGLWFATSWAAESCWGYGPAWEGQTPGSMGYLNGAPDKVGYRGSFCFGADAYARTVREAVLHHIRENHVRFVKLDGGSYYCDNAGHGHLPGKYSTERMFGNLIDIANAARAAAPDVFLMWYWGMRSPFWALYGDTIFESGVHLEGSGTSTFPTLYYRDSVTLAQDQAAQYAKTVPPMSKDSLGVWLADTRWGNFMGKERWREALVMDLGRGSLLFPNLWGDIYLLDDEDVRFLAWISAFVKDSESLLRHRRLILGDPWHNDAYGYAYCSQDRGLLFVNNASFVSRKVELTLDASIGLDAKAGTLLSVASLFADRRGVLGEGGEPLRAGSSLSLWLRPFEVLMLEVSPPSRAAQVLPTRDLTDEVAADLGVELSLKGASQEPDMAVRFSQEESFRQRGFVEQSIDLSGTVPSLDGPQPILAVAVQLRQGEAEWRYAPFVAEIVQVRARVGEQDVQLMPVPDARQFGNTQASGCSWVVYKVRLSPAWSGERLRLCVRAWLPTGVEAHVRTWVVKRWWQEATRPAADGYYTNAPS